MLPKNLVDNVQALVADIFADIEGLAGFIKSAENLSLLRQLITQGAEPYLQEAFDARENNPLHRKAFATILVLQKLQLEFAAIDFAKMANSKDFIADTIVPFHNKLKKFAIDYSISDEGTLYTAMQNVLDNMKTAWHNEIKARKIDLGARETEDLYAKYTNDVAYHERTGSAILPSFNLLSTNRERLKNLARVNVNAAVSIDDYAKNNRYNAFIQTEVSKLKSAGFPVWKSISGDGNCYYRSVANQLLEQMVVFQDKNRTKFFQEKYAEFYQEQSGDLPPETFNKILDGLLTGDKNSLVALQHILNAYEGFDLAMVKLMRNLAAEYLQKNPEMTLNELPIAFAMADDKYFGNLPLYIDEVVLKMGVDAQDVVTSTMSKALGVDISTVSLDINKKTTYTIQEFSAEEPSSTQYSNSANYQLDKLHLYPFLKSGHYDAFRTDKLDQYIRNQGFNEVGIMDTDRLTGELASKGLSDDISAGFTYITNKLTINLSAQKFSDKPENETEKKIKVMQPPSFVLSSQAQAYIKEIQQLEQEYVGQEARSRGMISRNTINTFFKKSTAILVKAKGELSTQEFEHVEAARISLVFRLQDAEAKLANLATNKELLQENSISSEVLQTIKAQAYIKDIQQLEQEYIDQETRSHGVISKDTINTFFKKSTAILVKAKEGLSTQEFEHVEAARMSLVFRLQDAEAKLANLATNKELLQENSISSEVLQTIKAQAYIKDIQQLEQEYIDQETRSHGVISKDTINTFFKKSTAILVKAKEGLSTQEFEHVEAARMSLVFRLQDAEAKLENLATNKKRRSGLGL